MSFSDILRGIAERGRRAIPPASHPEPFAGLGYADELSVKREALLAFWQEAGLPGRPEPVVGAPVPRGYRTTTKRRVTANAGGVSLAFPGVRLPARGVAPSLLDLPEHRMAYAFLAERLGRPVVRPLASALNWIVVRGEARKLTVILNVRVFDAPVVRAAKLIAADLQREASLGVRAGLLYLDPTNSEYYLEARRPDVKMSGKRLFGPDWLEIDAGEVRLRLPPTVFSQVNGAMLPTLTTHARTLLGPLDGCALLDLYCGYGLLSLTVGGGALRVVGVDSDGPAIEAARANARHLRCSDRARFFEGRVDGPFLAERVRPSKDPEAAILDPPRQGTAPDVVPAVADRAPFRVLHFCCGTDEIPREVAAWSQSGYRLERAIPLDLFAGTAGLETLLLLTPRGG
jgi:hypothetical protein